MDSTPTLHLHLPLPPTTPAFTSSTFISGWEADVEGRWIRCAAGTVLGEIIILDSGIEI